MDSAIERRSDSTKLTTFRLFIWVVIAAGNSITCFLAFLSALVYGPETILVFAFAFGVVWVAYSVTRIQQLRRTV